MKRMFNKLLGAACGAGLLAGAVTSQAATINVSGELAGVQNWTAANEYVLNGYVYVLDGGVLNIEAGTVVRGKPGAAPNFGALFICRGGKINALGTSDRPIVFTSELDVLSDPFDIPLTDVGGRKLWGGVVLLGKGLINRADATSVNGNQTTDTSVPGTHLWQIYEGLADVNGTDAKPLHRFGGADNEDSSGVMKYVSIRHGGISLNADKEINGLSLGAVGRGTIIENVESYMQGDDGFEWWGGAVNSRYLTASYCDDEMFDMDEGHIGKHQFWFGLQGIASDEGMELNGQPSGGANVNIVGAQPFGKHQIYNVTLIGNKTDGGNDVMNTRSEYFGEIRNSVFEDFSGADQVSSVATYNGTVLNNHFFNNSGNGIGNLAGNVNTSEATDPLIANEDKTQAELLDPRPLAASPLLTGWVQAPVNGVFEQAAFKGAFDSTNLWISGWSALANNKHLVRACSTGTAPMPRVFPTVSTSGNDVTLTWTALPGMTYQLQVSTDASIAATTSWSNVGAAQRNVGESSVPQTYTDIGAIAGAGTKKYYRLITSL